MKTMNNIQKHFAKVKSFDLPSPSRLRWLILLHKDSKMVEVIPICVCGNRFECRYCQGKLQKKFFVKYIGVVQNFRYPALLTLTMKRSGEIGEDVERFKKYFARFERTKEFKQKVRAYIGRIEGTKNNVHIHLIVDCVWWSIYDIVELWEKITGGSGRIADIRRVKGNRKWGLNYVLKYVEKGFEGLDEEEKGRIGQVLKGKRLMFTSKGLSLLDNKGISGLKGRVCRMCGEVVEFVGIVKKVEDLGWWLLEWGIEHREIVVYAGKFIDYLDKEQRNCYIVI